MKFNTFLKFARPRYLWKHRSGFCALCRKRTWFLLSLPLESIRNDAICVRCGCVARHRHMAICILEAFAGQGISDLAAFGSHPGISVFNTASMGPIVKRMGQHPNIICTEYFDDVAPGQFKDGRMCQNLERLSFPDDCFDLILSEDVFEHLQDYRKGFLEVYRVLKPGGVHVFSVPFYHRSKSEDLFERKDGVLHPKGPIEYHGDPIRGLIPTYTYFGFDLAAYLGQVGYLVDIRVSKAADDIRFGTFDCLTFVTRKPV